MDSQITYKGWPDGEMTLPINYRDWAREEGCKDIILKRALALDCPLELYLQIRTDGHVRLAKTEWSNSDNTYWHIYSAPDKVEVWPEHKTTYLPITDAQARALALIFAGRVPAELNDSPEVLPATLLSGLGATPQELVADRGGVVEILKSMGEEVPLLA